MSIFKKITTTLALTFLVISFSLTGITPVQASAFDGNMRITTERFGYEGDTIVSISATREYQNYNCISGPVEFNGIDMTLIRENCQAAFNRFGESGRFAHISHFNARYGRNQVMIAFYTGQQDSAGNLIFQNQNGEPVSWQPFEPDFNAVFAATGRLICTTDGCEDFQFDIEPWTRVECNTATIGSFTAEETTAICNRSTNQNQHFSAKIQTQGRFPAEQTFLATWSGSSWLNPIDGGEASYR